MWQNIFANLANFAILFSRHWSNFSQNRWNMNSTFFFWKTTWNETEVLSGSKLQMSITLQFSEFQSGRESILVIWRRIAKSTRTPHVYSLNLILDTWFFEPQLTVDCGDKVKFGNLSIHGPGTWKVSVGALSTVQVDSGQKAQSRHSRGPGHS